MITQTNIRAGLLGAKLEHSFSPRIHGELADYSYRLFELEEREVEGFLRHGEFEALNVTIPYKQTVIPFLGELTEVATRIGAVNSILRKKDGTLVGHNTDYAGFCDLASSLHIPFSGKKVLVLGSGGASRTAVMVAKDRGAREVVVISRSGENHYGNLEKHADAEILINATPVGMYPRNGEAPLDINRLPHLQGVLDMIYNPARTKLLQDAAQKGIACRNGLLMLVSQARRAAEFFLGASIADSEVERITRAIARECENIILIGMPGCGKSTLGQRIAAETGRRFVDCDAEIVKEAGCSIPEIFEREGESGFRARETAVVARVCRESGLVIATGGGVVTQARNLPLLSQNGQVIFLDVPPEGLSVAGRPLSKARSPEVLYRERLPLYRAAANIILPITRDIDANTQKILEALQ